MEFSHMNPNKRYDVYDCVSGRLIKSGCKLIAIIPPGLPLSNDEIKKYYGIDESNPNWSNLHRSSRNSRFIFDKCVVPCISRYRVKVSQNES